MYNTVLKVIKCLHHNSKQDCKPSRFLAHHLSLARAGGSAVGPGGAGSAGTVSVAVGMAVAVTVGGSVGLLGAAIESLLDHLGVGKRSLAHLAQRLAGGRSLLVLAVGGKVEGDEEHKVRAENTHAAEGSKLLTSAGAGIGHPLEVGGGEVGVRRKVDEAKINDELDDLETGDPLLPPAADATGTLEVVPVHDDMDGQVKHDGDPGDSSAAD